MSDEVVVTIENGDEVVVAIETGADVVAVAEAIQEIIVEAGLSELQGMQLWKLLGLRYPEKRQEYITLAYAPGYSYSGSGEAGDITGDSTKWVGTNAFQEIAQCTLLQPVLRTAGILEFNITAEFKNPGTHGTGAETMTFELQSGLDYPANAGMPPTFATVATFVSQAIATGPGTGTLVFTFRLFVEGHQGATFFQAYHATCAVKNLTSGATTEVPFADRLTLDLTDDIVLRWRFKASVSPSNPDQKFNVTHLDAHVEMPSEFHPYD